MGRNKNILKLTDKQKKYFTSNKFRFITISTQAVIDRNEVLSLIESDVAVVHYAFILHDKDIIPESGDIKKAHTHIVLHLNNAFPLLKYVNIFKTTEVCGLDKSGAVNMYRYLTHETSEAIKQGKYRYSQADITTNDINYFRESLSSLATINDIFNDFDNNMSYRYMALKYGFNFVINYNRIREYYDKICAYEGRINSYLNFENDGVLFVQNDSNGNTETEIKTSTTDNTQ